jgi:APA family basic amino acid/polyamine antiporter
MAGVLLNLLLGLSRVLLAMGRRRDMPAVTARIAGRTATPWVAVLVVAAGVAGIASIGDVETTWTFSAFTVLVYYALTNLAALRLGDDDRRIPKWVAWAGLTACLGLAFWVDTTVWLIGLALIVVGLAWHEVIRRAGGRRPGALG